MNNGMHARICWHSAFFSRPSAFLLLVLIKIGWNTSSVLGWHKSSPCWGDWYWMEIVCVFVCQLGEWVDYSSPAEVVSLGRRTLLWVASGHRWIMAEHKPWQELLLNTVFQNDSMSQKIPPTAWPQNIVFITLCPNFCWENKMHEHSLIPHAIGLKIYQNPSAPLSHQTFQTLPQMELIS